jgi:uncharacterized membrane protein
MCGELQTGDDEMKQARDGFPRRVRTVLGIALLASLLSTAATAHRDQAPPESAPTAETPEEAITPPPAAAGAGLSTADLHRAPTFLEWLGRLHPSLVHFPIGLLIAAAFAELLLMTVGGDFFRNATRFCVWGGALGGAIAAPLGWLAASSGSHEAWLVELHRWLGTAAAGWALLVLGLSERAAHRDSARSALRAGMAFGAVRVGIAGFLGGSLVHGIDHLAW